MADNQTAATFLLTTVLVLIGLNLVLIRSIFDKLVNGGINADGKISALNKKSMLTFLKGAFAFYVVSIALAGFAIVGVSGLATDTSVGPLSQDNFRWGKWLTLLSLTFFVSGLSANGMGYLVAIIEYLPRKRG